MARYKKNNTPIIILLVLVILAASLLGGLVWFVSSHFFVGGRPYARDAEALDLRGKQISISDYRQIREELPDCLIRWDIPFQGQALPDDTTRLQILSLNQGDLEALSYFTKLEAVDAEGCRDYDNLMQLKAQYPDVQLTYTVSIGGQAYFQDARSVTTAELTEEEIALMAYLPQLKHVDASGCRDYDRIGALSQAFPDMEVSYQVELMGQTFTEADIEADFGTDPDVDVLMEKLAWLPHMQTVRFSEPTADPEALRSLVEAYPDITFIWTKTLLGKTFDSSAAECDLSDMDLIQGKIPRWEMETDAAETRALTEQVKEIMAWFPCVEKVILPAYSLDNTVMEAFREEMRPEYKVVWTVYVTKKPVRTDQEVIHSSAYKVCFIDEMSQDLRYCEDAIVVDIGHSYVKDISWVEGMPNLQYLILTHNWVKDLTPVSTCKNLVYLELFWNDHIPDYTPILGCTALEDLNISATWADIDPLYEMTWLKNLWANCKGISAAEDAALKEALPNTTVMTTGGSYTTGGWRQVQGYYDMRDIMGLPYNHW